jgi:hypothetical protein
MPTNVSHLMCKRNCFLNLNKSTNIKANHLHNVSPILSATSLFHSVLYLQPPKRSIALKRSLYTTLYPTSPSVNLN